MTKESKNTPDIQATISAGSIQGQVAVGTNIVQTKKIGLMPPEITEAERLTLNRMLADLADQVKRKAPADKKAAALERITELDEAINEAEPDLPTMEYVKRWFGKNLPALAGAVTSLVVHPIVGKLVEAAGETVAAEFRRRFGEG